MADADSLDPPKRSGGDAAHALARAALGAIPVAGSAAVELFTAIIAPPLEKRRDEWMRDVGEALHNLESERGVDVNALKDNPVFIDTALQASQAALRTSQAEKRTALRNALLNAASPDAPEQTLQQMYLRWVEELTVWHLRILQLFDDPAAWFSATGRSAPEGFAGSLSQVLETAYPELRGRRSFYDQVWNDLRHHGLVSTDMLHGMMTGPGTMASRTSELASGLMRFITAPL